MLRSTNIKEKKIGTFAGAYKLAEIAMASRKYFTEDMVGDSLMKIIELA